ncbi:sodium-coupled monocarboxylate transporter [Holotrichia oblita]|uniref:Sodium-coupled monocarboxylate transporter n=1 Tax=Holotrichia oblita TaxID=644536 RepID=A0ACB9TFL2_HOLOL|nr:sodium-coupled monocarboxylate transporter [Holotrichia oblita]
MAINIFGAWDYVVLVLVLLVSSGIGIYYRLTGGKQKTVQYLERRFGQSTRLAASLCYSLQMVLYMGIVLYAPALALEALTGISRVSAILSTGLVCTFYSTIGGMKAVLMTDVFQSLLMYAAIFSVIICAGIQKGSLSEIWRIAEEGGRTSILNFNPDPTIRHSWFTLVIGGGITFLSLYGVNQTQVQRYLTIRSLKNAQKALWLNLPILSILSFSTSFAGLSIYSRYFDCDPVSAKIIASNDQLMPYFVVDSMGHIPGLSGIFVAGIFSASLSTISAGLNSMAAVTMEDYFKPIYRRCKRKDITEGLNSALTKLFACSYGMACIAIAFLAQYLGGVLQASLTIFGVVGGPLLGVFTLGMFTTFANQRGALTGLIIGLSLALWMAFGGPRPPLPTLPVSTYGCDADLGITQPVNITHSKPNTEYFWLYRVSYLYNGVFGLLSTLIFGTLASFISRKLIDNTNTEDDCIDPNLFVPPLAKKIRNRLEKSMKLVTVSCSSFI